MDYYEKIRVFITELVKNLYGRRKLILALSCVVVFMTTYLLILPAFTLDKEEAAEQGGIDVPATEQSIDADQALEESPSEEALATEETEPVESEESNPSSDESTIKEDEAPSEETTEEVVEEEAYASVILQNDENDDFSVAVEGTDAILSEDMSIKVREIDKRSKKLKKEYDSLYSDALDVVQQEEGTDTPSDFAFAKFYDISLMDGEDEVEPNSAVDVKISFSKKLQKELKVADSDRVYIVHFAVDKETGEVIPEVLDTDSTDITIKNSKVTEAGFTTDSFSVFAVVYTVDFHYEVDGQQYDFSMDGGSYISLAQLIEKLEISSKDTDSFLADVDNVEFSNPELVWVGKAENDTTVGDLKKENGLEPEYSTDLTKEQIEEVDAQAVKGGDWALISLKPFNTEESLTVTMKNGDQFVVKVTDAQKITNAANVDDGVYYIYNNSYRFLQANNGENNVDIVSEIPDDNDDYKWIVTRDGDTVIIKSFSSDTYLTLGGENNSYELFSETSAPITITGSNGIAIENEDGKKLGWGGSSKPYYVIKAASGSASKMTFYKLNAEAATFTVQVQNLDTSKGTVSGTGTTGSNNNVASYVATTKANGTNNNSITATPAPGYKFKCWLLNNEELSIHHNVIAAGDISVSNQDVLTAVFEVDPDYNQVIDDTDYEAMIEAWKKRLFKDQLVCDKTAQVYDYDNRIYKVDMSATSGFKVIDPAIELVFIVDRSRSMYFPAKLDQIENGSYTNLKTWLDSHVISKTYYTIGNPETDSTVYALKYTNYYADSSSGNEYTHNSSKWCYVDASYFEPNNNKDGVATKKLTPVPDNGVLENKEMDGKIYESTDPNGWLRLNYLKQAVTMASDVVFDLDPKATIGLVTFADGATNVGSYKKEDLGDLKNAVTNISGQAKTDQYAGLKNANDNYFKTDGKNRIAIFITDGAPNARNYTLGWTPELNPGKQRYNSEPAGWLKDNNVNLYTIGLSVDNVQYAEAGLAAISSGDGYHFAAEDSADLVEYIENIVQNAITDADLVGTVTDTLDPAFYPVMQDGTPIQPGLYSSNKLGTVDYNNKLGEVNQYIGSDGNPISNKVTESTQVYELVSAGYENVWHWTVFPFGYWSVEWVEHWDWVTKYTEVEKNPILNGTPCTLWNQNSDGTWTVTYYNQEFDRITDTNPDSWNGSFYAKVKEDFMGGNTVSTNSGNATVVADRYIPEGSTIIKEFDDKSLVPLTEEMETPHVNVDELHITEHSTEWTVYLGTEVTPEDQLAALWNNIKIKEVVDKNGTIENFSLIEDKDQMWYQHDEQMDPADEEEPADDDNNCELVPLSHYNLDSYYTPLLNALKSGNSYDSGDISYNGYGHAGIGTFQIVATKEIVDGAEDAIDKAPGTHITDMAHSPAEVYTIQVIYKPNTEGASEHYDHTAFGGTAGKVTTTNNSEDQVDSENEHRINVIKKGLTVEKVDESGDKINNPATFVLCRPALGDETVTPIDGLDGSYHVVDTLVTTGGSDTLDSMLQELRQLSTGESYYLVETDSPDGFVQIDHPIPVNVNVTPGEQTKPYEATQGITELINVGMPEASVVINSEDAEEGTHTEDSFVIKVINQAASVDIIIHKVNDKNEPLSDAVFKLTNGSSVVSIASEGTGVVIEPKVPGQTVTIKDNTFTIPEGGVIIRNLKTSDNTYSIVEVSPPDGYILVNETPATFKVSAGSVTDESHISGVTYQPETNDFTIPNEPGAALPQAGGIGTTIFYIIGAILTLGCSVMLISRRRIEKNN